jgi:hypothetical protein
MEYTRTLTPSLSHSMGEGARRAGEGRLVVYPGHSVVMRKKRLQLETLVYRERFEASFPSPLV